MHDGPNRTVDDLAGSSGIGQIQIVFQYSVYLRGARKESFQCVLATKESLIFVHAEDTTPESVKDFFARTPIPQFVKGVRFEVSDLERQELKSELLSKTSLNSAFNDFMGLWLGTGASSPTLSLTSLHLSSISLADITFGRICCSSVQTFELENVYLATTDRSLKSCDHLRPILPDTVFAMPISVCNMGPASSLVSSAALSRV